MSRSEWRASLCLALSREGEWRCRNQWRRPCTFPVLAWCPESAATVRLSVANIEMLILSMISEEQDRTPFSTRAVAPSVRLMTMILAPSVRCIARGVAGPVEYGRLLFATVVKEDEKTRRGWYGRRKRCGICIAMPVKFPVGAKRNDKYDDGGWCVCVVELTRVAVVRS